MKKHGDERNQTNANRVTQPKSSNMPDNRTWKLIAMKAYELYEQRGRADGHDVEDWLQAEARVNGRSE